MVRLLELDALSAAKAVASPLPDEGGAEQGLPLAPPLPHEHQRLRGMLLRMLNARGAA
jgi:hypothetical protein